MHEVLGAFMQRLEHLRSLDNLASYMWRNISINNTVTLQLAAGELL